jgi:hypothetical protein
MTKQEIYNYLKRRPNHVLCELTKDSFRLAKEFWKDDKAFAVAKTPLGQMPLPIWTYHLQQVVLEVSPLSYLRQFIPKSSEKVYKKKHEEAD